MKRALRCDLAVPFAALYDSRAETADAVKFACAGEVEHASEFVCRLHSNVLGAMLRSKFKEGVERSLEVDPRYAPLWPLVIGFFYGLPLAVDEKFDSGGSGWFKSLCLLHELADYYGILVLKDSTKNMLLAEKWSQEDCLAVLRNPQLRSDMKLVELALSFLSQKPGALFEDPTFVTLDKETVLDFVRGQPLQCSEVYIFKALLKWQKTQKHPREDQGISQLAKRSKKMSEKTQEPCEKDSEGEEGCRPQDLLLEESVEAISGHKEKTESKDSKTEEGNRPQELLLEEFAEAIFFGDMSSADLCSIRPHLKLETYVFYLEMIAGCQDKGNSRDGLPARYMKGVMRCKVCGQEEDASGDTECALYHPGECVSRSERLKVKYRCWGHKDYCPSCSTCDSSYGWTTERNQYYSCCGMIGTSSGCKRKDHMYAESFEELQLREDKVL